jgi:dTDP-4-amino-4,6-dideoxygalactose transaminase
MRNIPFFDYKKLFGNDLKQINKIIEDLCLRGAFIMQSDLKSFEENLAKFQKLIFSIGVGNATDGLEILLQAMQIKKGDEIIISSHTMLATASAVVTAGGVPVPVDIGSDNLISPESIEQAITKNTVGIIPTQLNGRICDMASIELIAKKNNLFIIEDAAQALGSKYFGKYAGSFGAGASISFFPAKVLGCFGDGGAIITNDNNIYEKCYQLHDHGRNKEGEVVTWGRNSRLDNLNAAILNWKLASYEEVIARRRIVASIYHERLSKLDEITLPPGPNENNERFDVYQNYEVSAYKRDALKEYLSNQGIGTLIQWGGKAIHQFECFEFNKTLPNVETFFKRCLMLPMNIFISDDDVHYICDNVYKFYRG